MKGRASALRLFIIIMFVIVADQLIKQWVVQFLKRAACESGQTLEYISYPVTSFFSLSYVWNYGITFGVFNQYGQSQLLLICISILIITGLIMFLLRTEVSELFGKGAGLVIGGAIGNIIDRFRFGAVFDFLDFYIGRYHYPSFNIADSAIVIGIIVMAFNMQSMGSSA